MPIPDGSVIEFDYDLWVEGREGLYDTTDRAAAEKAGILEENAHYSPVVLVLGAGRIISGLEESLRASALGKTEEVELPADKAYGNRDAKLIETIPIHEFRKNDVAPEVGTQVRYRNKAGVVTLVGGGRVRVDFNPPLAGKKLKYRYTVRKVYSDDAGKVEGLVRMNFPANVEWTVKVASTDGKKTATIEVPEGVGAHQNWAQAKLRTIIDVSRYSEVEAVRFIETYNLPKRNEEAVAKTA